MSISNIAFGSPAEVGQVDALKAALAEFFSMLIFVIAGEGGANISGGRVNPAVTFGAFPGGNVTFIRSISLLKLATGVVFETVMTFGLVYTFYAAAVDPKKCSVGIIGPIAIGFIVGANILAGGAFDGASINPAVSFGLAVVSWTRDNHWVYWLGPLVGSAIAAIVYEVCFISPTTHNHVRMTRMVSTCIIDMSLQHPISHRIMIVGLTCKLY
ncbi:hypothetical protein DKX38_013755 [Salix brachista]|uniref:Aquaporin n=1 Tax=Salix brachista TaxID=2182728 RepID=A0A5N5LF86_9ROSI|nr:hypothetical protein DKX38_013755 [Salix brachista]